MIGTRTDKSLSEPWIVALLKKKKKTPEGYMWGQGRLTKKQVTATPGNMWQAEWSNVSKVDAARGQPGILFYSKRRILTLKKT